MESEIIRISPPKDATSVDAVVARCRVSVGCTGTLKVTSTSMLIVDECSHTRTTVSNCSVCGGILTEVHHLKVV
jgi:hypothetical protein